jgi:1-deoxy-D-xylulose-5-phosphate synthase
MSTQTPLKDITSPEQIKSFSTEELEALAEEVRQRIIEVMSVNGGHLATSLGATDIIIAMHKVFNAPTDMMTWDVGHQTYAHKLLTGRYEGFSKIRKFKGLCGFTHTKESPFDHFHAGHAGTALPLALGVAKRRDLSNEDFHVVPMIGDATLTCGLTLEALNNIPQKLKRFVLILNDNKMSISQNVGAITHILSRMINNPRTSKIQHDLKSFLSKIPSYGEMFAEQGNKVAESIKNLVSPAAFFEQYGLSYIGPIDGHDIKQLVETFEAVKNSEWPVIIHTLTNKGQGVEIAVKNPTIWHGAKPFDVDTYKFLPSSATKPTFPKIFGKHLIKMAETDPDIVVVTPAMTAGSSIDDFREKYPDQCIDVGMAEGFSLTFAGGIGYKEKKKVFASIYSTFLQRALDNLFHDICLQEIPVVLTIDRAGIAGGDGATHNGIYDISFLNAMPNMVITQPRNGHILKELMSSAHSWRRPTAIRYPNLSTDEESDVIEYRKLGQGELAAEGNDILLIGLGHMVYTALEVRDLLKEKGISACVVDPIFIKPLDSELLNPLMSAHSRLVTIEEHSVSCGLGSIINNYVVQQKHRHLQILNCGIPETFVEHGDHSSLIKELGLDAKSIAKRIDHHFSFSKQAKVLS